MFDIWSEAKVEYWKIYKEYEERRNKWLEDTWEKFSG
jgi:hypothetical protein